MNERVTITIEQIAIRVYDNIKFFLDKHSKEG